MESPAPSEGVRVAGNTGSTFTHGRFPGGGANAHRPSPLAMAALSGQSVCRGLVQGSRRQTRLEVRLGTSRPQGHSGSDFFGGVGGEQCLCFLNFLLECQLHCTLRRSSGGFPYAPTQAQLPPTLCHIGTSPPEGHVCSHRWTESGFLDGTCWDPPHPTPPHPTPGADLI